MSNINTNRRFNEAANIFELPIHDLKNMDEKQIAPAKSEPDRVKFGRYDAGGGEITDLPIVFEFGLLNKHNMGGWEVSEEMKENDHFSFTFRWDEEHYANREVLDELRIKATSIVVLWDEDTSTIVNFDVEPGFEHQWGYGRQRFLKQSTLNANSNKVRAQAIIKEWSEQHEYELGKYAIDLLRQSKANRAEISRHIKFIVDQAEQESEWSTQKAKLEQQNNILNEKIIVLEQTKIDLKTSQEANELLIEKLRLEIAAKTAEIAKQAAEIAKLQEELDNVPDSDDDVPDGDSVQTQQQLGGGVSGSSDTGSAQIGRDASAQIAELKAKIVSRDDEIAALKAEIATLKQQMEDANTAHAAALLASQDKCAALEADLATKKAEIEDLNIKAADALAVVKQFNADKDTLLAKITEFEINIQKTADLVKAQAQANADLQAKFDKAVADAATDLAAANVATEALKTTVAEKETELGEEKAKNATLTTTVTTLEAEVLTAKKTVQIIINKHNDCRERLIKAKAGIDMSRKNAREAIELLKPIAGLAEVIIPDFEDGGSIIINTTDESTAVKVTETTTTTAVTADSSDSSDDDAEPAKVTVVDPVTVIEADKVSSSSSSSSSDDDEPAVVVPVVDESIIEAEKVPSRSSSSSSSSSDNASDVDVVPLTPENVSEIVDEDDMIIADKVAEKASPVFFPAKNEPAIEADKLGGADKISIKSSTVSETPTTKAEKQRKGSKSLAKFDLKMGVKKDKKESGFGKFISMCTRGGAKKDKKTTIENSDPQLNPPKSPTQQH